jgi:hypothetical protein
MVQELVADHEVHGTGLDGQARGIGLAHLDVATQSTRNQACSIDGVRINVHADDGPNRKLPSQNLEGDTLPTSGIQDRLEWPATR